MKITGLKTYRVKMPYHRPHALSFYVVNKADLVIVRLTTDEGIEGVGETSLLQGPSPFNDESAESVQAACEKYLFPLIEGMDPLSPALVADKMAKSIKGNSFARSAIEMAVFDIAGKAQGVPAYQLLGGYRRKSILMAWSIASGDPQFEIEEAEKIHETLGITTFKVKMGHLPPKEDLQRIETLAAAWNGRYHIRTDVNQGWDETTAAHMLREMAHMGIQVVEQPVPRKDIHAMARLRSLGLVPIMADESVFDINDALDVIRYSAADVIALKLGKAGGLLATCQIGALAAWAGIPCVLGQMQESAIGTAGYLHAGAATAELSLGGVQVGPLLHKRSLVKKDLIYRDGVVMVPEGNGLGVEVDWDVVHELAV